MVSDAGVAALAAPHGDGHGRSAGVASLPLDGKTAHGYGEHGGIVIVVFHTRASRDQLASLENSDYVRIPAPPEAAGFEHLDGKLSLEAGA